MSQVTRRRILLAGAAAIAVARGDEPAPEVSIVEFNDAGLRTGVVRVKKVIHTEAEWRKLLTLQQLYVARKGNSDVPYYGTYFKLHDAGIYRCICCNNAVFSSTAKFDSRSGFPCFKEPIAEENIYTRLSAEEGPQQVEVMCKRCDGHLGYVYNDGPEPAHLRYTISESALKFVPLAK